MSMRAGGGYYCLPPILEATALVPPPIALVVFITILIVLRGVVWVGLGTLVDVIGRLSRSLGVRRPTSALD